MCPHLRGEKKRRKFCEEERQAAASGDRKTMRRHWVMKARDLGKKLPFTFGSGRSSLKKMESRRSKWHKQRNSRIEL